jgi:hypothetical protein
MNMTKELSESLLAACKAAGIEKPKYIAQDKSGFVFYYKVKPNMLKCEWLHDDNEDEFGVLNHPPYAEDWKESLLEWVDKPSAAWDDFVTGVEQHTGAIASCTADSKQQEILPTVFIPHEGEPLADVLARHPDTSKKIDDACKIAYQNHLRKGDGLCWSRANDYRQGWQDALAWKGGSDD